MRLIRKMMTRPKGPCVLLVLAGALPLAAGGLLLPLLAAPSPHCQQIAVPAYFYPGADWTRAVSSRPAPGIMILNVSSGPGGAPDPNYQKAVRRAQAAGVRVLGYSDTDYARRAAAAVEADIRDYRAWYHVTDIFLDEAASGSGSLAYYRRLTSYVRDVRPDSVVMLNPGTYPDRRYMSLRDTVLAYEGSYAGYVSLRVPGWAYDYPAARFAHVIYDTPGARLANAITLSGQRHAGNVFVTDGTLPNPYQSLPGYWAAEDAIVARNCGIPNP
jgi:hypothetical protein